MCVFLNNAKMDENQGDELKLSEAAAHDGNSEDAPDRTDGVKK